MSFDDGRNESTIIFDLMLVHSTNMAYLVRDVDDNEAWIPKSQVRDISFGDDISDDQGNRLKEILSIEIPIWLAEDKGLA
jgi:hypothetical protein